MLFEALMNHLQNIETTVLNRGIEAVEPRTVLLVAQEFASRTVIPPGGFRWWADALAFDTYNRSRATYTLAGVARDANVSYNRIANAALTPAEGERACEVLMLKRDAALGAVFTFAEQHYRALAEQLAQIPDAAAGILASADLIAEANGPLRYLRGAQPEEAALGDTPEPVLARSVASPYVRTQMHCERCGHDWKARVEQPRKCPRCQVELIWSTNEQEEAHAEDR